MAGSVVLAMLAAVLVMTLFAATLLVAWKPMLYGSAAAGFLAVIAGVLGYSDAATFLTLVLLWMPVFALEWESG